MALRKRLPRGKGDPSGGALFRLAEERVPPAHHPPLPKVNTLHGLPHISLALAPHPLSFKSSPTPQAYPSKPRQLNPLRSDPHPLRSAFTYFLLFASRPSLLTKDFSGTCEAIHR
jgi:hypothetical protein